MAPPGRMALLLLTLRLGLVSAQPLDLRKVVQWNYNLAKVSGNWISNSMASDDLRRIQANGDLRLFVRNIEVLTNGSLRLGFELMLQGECVHVAVVCEKTEKNGVFTITYEGHNTLSIVETDYELYITFYLWNLRNGKETRVLALYGRFPDLSTPFLERFKKTCRKYGISPQNIISLIGKSDGC